MTQPLDHIRVLDMSRILAGPWCGQTFADLGADVIKIERPGVGDDTRGWGPPFMTDRDGVETDVAAYFLSANRGKKSVTVDITKPEGQELIRGLTCECDVLLENYKVGGLKKYGLDYESLSKVNPRLVYCSITGFGQTGPYSPRAGYDFLIQAMGGLMSVTGEAEDKPGGGPQKIGVALSDILTGLYTTIGALSALAYRDKTGRGQHVDMALLDVTVAATANQAMNYLVTGKAPTMMGNAHPNIVPYEAYKAADHYIILATGNDGQYQRFCDVAGRPDLATDERFATNRKRVENRGILGPMLNEIIGAKPACSGSKSSKKSVCRAGRSTIWNRSSTIRTFRRARFSVKSNIRWVAQFPPSRIRSACPKVRSNIIGRRPGWVSTPMRYWRKCSASTPRRSAACGMRA